MAQAQIIEFRYAGLGKTNVCFNIAGAVFQTGPLSTKTVEIAKRVVIAAVILAAIATQFQAVIFGLAVGVFSIVSGKATVAQAENIFNRILRAEAAPQLGIALAAFFVTPIVVCAAAALTGALSMKGV